ncbi:MAG TPA: hypothetical protein VMS64_05630 [Candidatus Methylomirabilis sp.]|nr:hypothetical protein [Candidatus Methylomirabilis sp.]
MPLPRERRWPRLVAGYTVLLALVAGAATPIYFLLEPGNRPLVIRLGSALILLVVLIHLLGTLRARLDAQRPSGLERALVPQRQQQTLDPRFVQIRDELRESAWSRRYFDHVLWPELIALAGRAPHGPSRPSLVRPPGRFFRRGPALTTLRELIAVIEETRE